MVHELLRYMKSMNTHGEKIKDKNYLNICLQRLFSQPIFKWHHLNKIQGRYCLRIIAHCFFFFFWEFYRNMNLLCGQNAELALVGILQQPVCFKAFAYSMDICVIPLVLAATMVSELLQSILNNVQCRRHSVCWWLYTIWLADSLLRW